MATASPVSKFPLDDGHRAFLPIILRELILCAFQKHEVRSNPFYPWARFSDFSRYIQLVKKNLRELHLSQNIFIRVCLYHISEYPTRGWEEKGTKRCDIPQHSVIRLWFSQTGTLATMSSHHQLTLTFSLTDVTDWPELLPLPSY